MCVRRASNNRDQITEADVSIDRANAQHATFNYCLSGQLSPRGFRLTIIKFGRTNGVWANKCLSRAAIKKTQPLLRIESIILARRNINTERGNFCDKTNLLIT